MIHLHLIHSSPYVSHAAQTKLLMLAHFLCWMNWNYLKACFNITKMSSPRLILTCQESIHL